MSSNLLEKIGAIIRKNNEADNNILNSIILFLKNYKENMWIYPGILSRKFNLRMIDAYEILECMEKEGVIKSYYEQYCPKCHKTNGIVHVFNEIPVSFECELCNEELNGIENSFMLYKVIKNELCE